MEVNCEFKAIRTGICPFHTKAIKKTTFADLQPNH